MTKLCRHCGDNQQAGEDISLRVLICTQSSRNPLESDRAHQIPFRIPTHQHQTLTPAYISPTRTPATMAKLIVVCGATGGLGGSVARRMLQEGWKVRGITRNKDSAGAKALVEAGAELASANYDDVASLEAAFEGADAIFGVTNFWEYLLELGAPAAAKKETQQLVNIAIAANKISGLEHLVLHTLPSGEKLGGKYVPHMDVSWSSFEILELAMYLLIICTRAKTKPPTTSKCNSRTSRRKPPSSGSAFSRVTSGRTL
jgi:hypothetical protein